MTDLHNTVSLEQNFLFFFVIITVLNYTIITLTALPGLSSQGQKAIQRYGWKDKGNHVCLECNASLLLTCELFLLL